MAARNNSIAGTPDPPYFAVIFTSQRTDGDKGYGQMAEQMAELAAQQPGFLGIETVRDANGFGINVSYWASIEAISPLEAPGGARGRTKGGQARLVCRLPTADLRGATCLRQG